MSGSLAQRGSAHCKPASPPDQRPPIDSSNERGTTSGRHQNPAGAARLPDAPPGQGALTSAPVPHQRSRPSPALLPSPALPFVSTCERAHNREKSVATREKNSVMRTFVEDRPEATWPSATLPESLHGGPAVPWRAVAWACSGPSSGACVRRLGAPCRNCRVCYSSMGKAKVDGEHAPSLPAGLRRPKARLLSAARFDCSKLGSFEVMGAPRIIQSPLRRRKQRHGARQLRRSWIRSPRFT